MGVAVHRLRTRRGTRLTNGIEPISVVERKVGAGPHQWLALTAIALAAVAADQLTKRIVASELAVGEGVHVVGPFWIRHVQNSGIAFGLFSQATTVVIVLTAIAVVWMLLFFARSGARHPILPVALGLILGGSLSNLADRVRVGYVTDSLDLGWWPTFNLADIFIVVGVLVLLAALVLAEREPRGPQRLRDAPPRPS